MVLSGLQGRLMPMINATHQDDEGSMPS